jgi:pimeloyl-ACP methyl ester carboxylesterase
VAKHRQPTANKWAPYVTTGIALNAATLFAFTYATDSHVTIDSMLAASTSIFVDGTKSITGNEEGISPYRMADSFMGIYDRTAPGREGTNVFVDYPRSLGPLTGFGDPTYDASEGEATTKTVAAVETARKANPGDKIYVVGYSQGAGAASQAIAQLKADGAALHGDDNYYLNNVEFVLAADPRRNDGGILARLPKGVYIPILGVSFGDGTSAQGTNAKILQVTKQYDGVADAPNYIFNVVADLNAVMGFYYLHSGYYKDVNLGEIPADGKIVTSGSAIGADGEPLVTDVLIKAPVGELPLTMPLLQLGVPRSVIEALDPFLRAIIETGYDRPEVAPSQPVPFQLLPPASKWLPDVQSVATGAVETGRALTGTAPVPSDPVVNNNKLTVTTFVEPGPVSGQDVVEGQDPPPSDTPDPEDFVVDSSKAPTTPTQVKPKTTVNKFKPFGGWKPGDLLRKIVHPQPMAGGSSDDRHTTAPDPPSQPPADNDDASKKDGLAKDAA